MEDDIIAVIKDGEVVFMKREELDLLIVNEKGLILAVIDGKEYYTTPILSDEDFKAFAELTGFQFINDVTLVNPRQVSTIDEENGIVTFIGGSQLSTKKQ